jgi:hypothetical protein
MRVAEDCTAQLDSTWITRPPVVSSSTADQHPATIVFSRVVVQDSGDVQRRELFLESRTMEVHSNGRCVPSEIRSRALGIILEPKPNVGTRVRETTDEDRKALREWDDATSDALAKVRARPLLAVDMGQDGRYLVIPDGSHPARSLLLSSP